MIDAFIGIGSNMGDRLANIAAGVAALVGLPVTRLVLVSHVYESEPWGPDGQQTYYNAAAHIVTDLYADQLLDLLKEAEEGLGREPAARFSPRPIDLDILLFGDEEWESARLTIPHPRMRDRDFVITPLLEIAPDVTYPDGLPVANDAGASQGPVLGIVGEVPGFEEQTPQPPAPALAGPPPGAETDLGPADLPRSFASADFRVPGTGESFRTVEGEEWLPLGVAALDPSPSVPELVFYDAVLNDANVPHEYYPQAPGESGYGPYGVPRFIDIYVPARHLAEARDLIRQARQAPSDVPEG